MLKKRSSGNFGVDLVKDMEFCQKLNTHSQVYVVYSYIWLLHSEIKCSKVSGDTIRWKKRSRDPRDLWLYGLTCVVRLIIYVSANCSWIGYYLHICGKEWLYGDHKYNSSFLDCDEVVRCVVEWESLLRIILPGSVSGYVFYQNCPHLEVQQSTEYKSVKKRDSFVS